MSIYQHEYQAAQGKAFWSREEESSFSGEKTTSIPVSLFYGAGGTRLANKNQKANESRLD